MAGGGLQVRSNACVVAMVYLDVSFFLTIVIQLSSLAAPPGGHRLDGASQAHLLPGIARLRVRHICA